MAGKTFDLLCDGPDEFGPLGQPRLRSCLEVVKLLMLNVSMQHIIYWQYVKLNSESRRTIMYYDFLSKALEKHNFDKNYIQLGS